MTFKTKTLLLLLALLLVVGCQTTGSELSRKGPDTKKSKDKTALLILTVSYREKLMLPDGCKLIVSLEDISRLDSAGKIVATRTANVKAAPPFRMIIPYVPEYLDARHTYQLTASIMYNGQLFFQSKSRINPLESPGKPIPIVVKKVQ